MWRNGDNNIKCLFEDVPVGGNFMFGVVSFVKTCEAPVGVPISEQEPNCINLRNGHHCAIGAKAKVLFIRRECMEEIEARNLMKLMETDQECLIRELEIVRAGVLTEWGRHAIDVAIGQISYSVCDVDSDKAKEVVTQFENAIGLIEQDGKDYLDERDIPILENAIKLINQRAKYRKKAKRFKRKFLELKKEMKNGQE